MLNENVVKVLKAGMWHIATCADGVPNVVPVGFKDVTDDGKLLIGDVLMETTVKNILANPKIAISACEGRAGYQIKGSVEYVTSGPVYDKIQAMAEQLFHGAMKAKGALIVTPERVIVTTAGPDNKKEL